uniref:DUF4005 domain-containing protein n=2 Tax=Oryza brachyantha TaxID=4533 RepID=J3NES7_ORYBR
MGKAGRWLRSFLTGKKDRKGKDKGDGQSASSTMAPTTTPSAREKRRWSFRRPAVVTGGKEASAYSQGQGQGQLASTSSHCFSDVQAVVHDQLAAVAASPAPERTAYDVVEEAAATKIQSAFRSYLARKALCALRGMVKLQAMVRGQLVRRQASMTLHRMQALVAAQRRA